MREIKEKEEIELKKGKYHFLNKTLIKINKISFSSIFYWLIMFIFIIGSMISLLSGIIELHMLNLERNLLSIISNEKIITSMFFLSTTVFGLFFKDDKEETAILILLGIIGLTCLILSIINVRYIFENMYMYY